MAPAPSSLPTRFPCWCKAVYSWGGETKRDLGFIEGDLIECLNAGDGSWWMGRLKRDRRMVGLFPSNFVEVLDESFQPGSRTVSPLPPSRHGSNVSTGGSAVSTPQKAKSVFRKPFQAYSAASQPNPAAAARLSNSPSATPPGSVSKRAPFSSMKKSSSVNTTPTVPQTLERPSDMSRFRAVSPRPTSRGNPQSQMRARSPAPPRARSPAPPRAYHDYSRAASPAPDLYRSYSPAPPAPVQAPMPVAAPMHYQSHPRAHSPMPQEYQSHSRAHSPMPQEYQSYSRGPSPSPYQAYNPSRAASPNPYALEGSPAPPAPPPHRIEYNHSRAPSPQPMALVPYNDGRRTPGDYSHRPASSAKSTRSGRSGMTPSPLTNAMNDVMSSLHGMSVQRSHSPDRPKSPISVWSPEAFGQSFAQPRKHARSHTAIGITGVDSGYGSATVDEYAQDDAPQLHNYVQRMETRLRRLHQEEDVHSPMVDEDIPPRPPSKGSMYSRPESRGPEVSTLRGTRRLKKRKSAYEMGRGMLDRTFTTKSTVTNQSSSTNSSQATNKSIMSGYSATNMSATSAGSLAKKRFGLGGTIKNKDQSRPMSVMEGRNHSRIGFNFGNNSRPQTPSTGISYHSSHNSSRAGAQSAMDWTGGIHDGPSDTGGLCTPKARKSGFFKRMAATVKTGAATARSTLSTSRPGSPTKSISSNSMTGLAGPTMGQPVASTAARDMGLGGGVDWMQVRRDINRSNSLSKNERSERAERCEMLDLPVLDPISELYATAEGDEGLDGLPVTQVTDFTTATNLALVDKGARFAQNIPPSTTPANLAQSYICRPYRSEVQKLRAIFTWVSERICWEDDFEGPVDARRVIQTKRGCTEEITLLVMEMCSSVGIYCEVVRGYLKMPGETLDFDAPNRPNHWWNAVIVDGEWRIMDCSLANPSNPRRSAYSSMGSSQAESWWFLTRPLEICYTHVPVHPEQQHIVPPQPNEVLMALPCACPPYFQHAVQVVDFDTSLLHLENLEMTHVYVEVPEDVECFAEVEARAFAQDADGDYFESGEVVKKRSLTQVDWIGGRKRYTIKGLLPGDEGQGILKIYAGKRGLMHSITSNPHPLAVAFPISHNGNNPPFEFLKLHPTPHAQRNDLYVVQPQCFRLALNNTFVFCVRQHPSCVLMSPAPRSASPNPFARPTSAMSMASFSASGSAYSNPSATSSSSGSGSDKPAKLAIQSPAGKIIRLLRKNEVTTGGREQTDGTAWETIIKIGERGIWRGLVLADRSARWCVFAEWECV